MISGDAAMAELAVLNSSLTLALLRALSPTMNYEVGHILSLPRPPAGADKALAEGISDLIAESQYDWDDAETSLGFKVNPLAALASESD